MRADVVAERHFAKIAAIQRQQSTAEKPTKLNAPVPAIGSQIIRLALWVVELFLPCFYVHIRVRELTEINLRPRNGEIGRRTLHGHVAQQKQRQTFRSEAVHRIHGEAIAVRVNELFVDPIPAAFGEFIDVQFARGKHNLSQMPINDVPVDVDIRKVVVGANLLNLPQGVLQCMPVP